MKIIKSLLLTAACTAALSAPMAEAAGNSSSEARLSLGYLYGGSSSAYIQQVDRTQGTLNRVSPGFIDIQSDGTLKWASGIDAFVQSMHQRGIKVVPFLSNHWDREAGRQALENREALAEEIAGMVERTGLDGINVDIENVTETEREAYTDLVRLLRQKLPADKEVSVAVAANPNNWKTGWHGSYDLEALGELSDYILLMAYDESYEGDATPGPVASQPWVEDSVQEALKAVPAEKLLLGIPFYGRLWKDDGTLAGIGITSKQIEKLAASQQGSSVTYDAASRSAQLTFEVAPEDTAPVVSYRTLTPGSYTVWYENEASIKEKLKLVRKYNLKGAGVWALNQETADTWSYYQRWLNGSYFTDTDAHWALDDILTAADRGWMTGMTSTQFAPDAPLTRAQAAVILTRTLELETAAVPAQSSTGAAGASVGTADTARFTDVPASHWAAAEIALARQHGLVDGLGEGRFAPDAPLTREQLAAMLVRALNLPAAALPAKGAVTTAAAGLTFSDVPASRWSYASVMALAGRSIVNGMPDGSFGASAVTTRSQMAALLVRSAEELELAAAARAAN